MLLVFGGRVLGVEFVEEPNAGFLVDAQGLEEREGVGFERAFRVVVLASSGAGAPVVHVPLLLDVADEEAVAGPARKESGVREGVPSCLGARSSLEGELDAVVEVLGDEGLVISVVDLASPAERAVVRGVAQDGVRPCPCSGRVLVVSAGRDVVRSVWFAVRSTPRLLPRRRVP